MASAADINFNNLAPMIASRLLDNPNEKLSTASDLRFGSNGSMSIDLEAGTFYDHERKVGGGMLDLIRHMQGCDVAGALTWLEDEGLKDRTPRVAQVRQLADRHVGPVYYDYRDESGEVISRIKRTPDKRFWQLGPDGHGGFHAIKGCMTGVRRVPYRLPELLAADASRVVFVVEGEKDADRLATLGLISTTNAQGAGKFLPELVEHFAGRKVVIIADNDQAGRDHAADVAVKLAGVADTVGTLMLPGLPEKGDVSNWLDAGGTVESLKALARVSLEHAIPASLPGTAERGLVSATPYAWRLPATIAPRQWVYGRSIQRGHLRAVAAQGAAGKTILSVAEALCMTTGRNLLGHEVPGGPKRVWLWNLEDDADELARMIQAACLHWGITESDIGGRLFVDSALEGATLKTAVSNPATGFMINRPVIDALTEELKARGIDYLHVDPFVSSHSANENDNMEIDAIAKEWALVAKNAGAGIGLAHHISKAGAGEATAMHARGAVALINACRSVIVLNRMSDDEAKRYGIEGERRRRFFRVYDDKNNRAPPSDKSDWYQMVSVSLGNGEGDGGDSMGVVVPWSPPDAFEGVTTDHLYRVQQMVDAGTWWKDVQSKGWVGEAVASVMGLSADKEAVADRARLNSLLSTWYGTGALVIDDAVDPKSRKLRPAVKVGTWAVDGLAPPPKGGAEQGGAGRAGSCSTTTLPPLGEGVERTLQKPDNQVEQMRDPIFTAARPKGRMILAPGETGDEQIPGWDA